jgi:superfamily II DNA helicase RecQ
MKVRLFQYALPAPPELEDLNGYLGQEKVASLSHHVVSTAGGGAMLVFVVESAGRPASAAPTQAALPGGEPKVDYRKELSPEDFAVFSDLREARKRAAAAENVPVYSVFSNDHLAQMVRTRVNTEAGLRAIPGIADGKIGKYGAAMLVVLRAAFPDTGEGEKPA